MCQAVSLILKLDGTVILPDHNTWKDNHSDIFERMGIPEGAMTDSYARVEVVPKFLGRGCYRTDPTDEELWWFVLDEGRIPSWFAEDAVTLEYTCRKAVANFMKRVPIGVADYDVVISGDRGTSISGYHGTSTSGEVGTSISGECGTSTSGDYGTATCGDKGTSISGDGGTSTSGYDGTAKSGVDGILQIKYHDGDRPRIATAYVGENGIEPDTFYQVDENGKMYKVTKE